MRERTDRPTDLARRAQMQRRRQVTQTEHRAKNGSERMSAFNYGCCAHPKVLFPASALSISISDPLGTCLYYCGSNVARRGGWGRLGRVGRGMPNAHSSAIKDLLLARPPLSLPPISVFKRGREREGRKEAYMAGRGRAPSSPHHPSISPRFSYFAFLLPLTTILRVRGEISSN